MKNKLVKKFLIPLTIITFFLDWHSTIIQSPEVEENPIVQWIWVNGGDIGFTLFTLLIMALVIFIIVKIGKLAWIVLPLLLLKLIIALTNYDLVPYSWTGWL